MELLNDLAVASILADQHRDHDHGTLDHHLGILVDTHQVEAVVEQRDDRNPDERSMNSANTARQRRAAHDDGSQRVDYDFQLSLTDLRTGLILWEDTKPISKRGTNETVAW